MKILGFDTSAKTASVALWEDGKVTAEYFLDSGFTHSETVLPMAKSLLDAARCDVGDVDVFAVNCGPGSFTGLRIGIAAVKAMAMAKGRPCASVSSLEAIAQGLRGFEGIVCPVMDARCGQMYTAFFMAENGEVKRMTEDSTLMTDELFERIKEKSPVRVILAGDGAETCFKKFGSEFCDMAPEAVRLGKASGTCMVAARMAENDMLLTAGELVPNYLKLAQAEREKLEKEGKK